ncbi:hypothetical protein [Pseudolactococcus paracarnosus]|uniref:Uncharacterized protein n=1 Tax=Pseudolactococcus paracarnosus TaxID=2749962 RepID=A0ABT0APF7_9LACT|nr:hypothetical protein [Lactococcus paracarnosus]MCJ1978436.1 hypothetical protein [Lactococcus paracarnosus]MCJ1984585.1 hypothetical protein [Lactococcus paracarnosus]MCJ1999210.1 hypothetical protein [Lactococcus paracarnosus]
MKLKITPGSKGREHTLSYAKSELKHKDYLIDKMIAVRQKKLTNIETERIKLNEKLTLLVRGISDEILKTQRQIHDLCEVTPNKLNNEISSLIYFKGALENKDVEQGN